VQCSSIVSAWRREPNSHNATKLPERATLNGVSNPIHTAQRRVTIYLAAPKCLARHRLRSAELHPAALRGSQYLVSNRLCESACRPAAAGPAVPTLVGASGGRKSSAAATYRIGLLRHHQAWHPSGLHAPSQLRAVLPNPSLEPTRYGRQRKPGLRHMVHHLRPGLRCLPPRAAQLER
jgi:hypothetical protein